MTVSTDDDGGGEDQVTLSTILAKSNPCANQDRVCVICRASLGEDTGEDQNLEIIMIHDAKKGP